VERLAGSSHALARLESYKGYFFIGATALLLYVLVARLMRRIRAHQHELGELADRERMLLQELDHRVKNAMAGLLSMIDLCREEYTDTRTFATAMRRRVQAMADVHNLLAEGHWSAIDLHRLLAIMRPPQAPGRVVLEGPQVLVPPRQATAVGMIVQELMSNAVKHGALGHESGVLRIMWQVIEPANTERVLTLNWQESGGPPIAPVGAPDGTQAGLGTRLIRGFARSELRGSVELDFPSSGARHTLSVRLDGEAAPDTFAA
jgi:two-component sensor histidine kinase